MPDPYLGEIRLLSFAWAPKGWALCDGSLLSVQQNQALFGLLGNKFGGDGKINFALPDLRGRAAMGTGKLSTEPFSVSRGDKGGQETVSLMAGNTPSHTHQVLAYPAGGTSKTPVRNDFSSVVDAQAGSTTNFSIYLPADRWTAQAQLHPGTVSETGSNAAHNNLQPFAVVNFAICTHGTWPARS